VRGVKSLLIGDVQERIEKYSFKAHYTPKRASADHSSAKGNITTIIMRPTSMGRIRYCIFSVCLFVSLFRGSSFLENGETRKTET